MRHYYSFLDRNYNSYGWVNRIIRLLVKIKMAVTNDNFFNFTMPIQILGFFTVSHEMQESRWAFSSRRVVHLAEQIGHAISLPFLELVWLYLGLFMSPPSFLLLQDPPN